MELNLLTLPKQYKIRCLRYNQQHDKKIVSVYTGTFELNAPDEGFITISTERDGTFFISKEDFIDASEVKQ